MADLKAVVFMYFSNNTDDKNAYLTNKTPVFLEAYVKKLMDALEMNHDNADEQAEERPKIEIRIAGVGLGFETFHKQLKDRIQNKQTKDGESIFHRVSVTPINDRIETVYPSLWELINTAPKNPDASSSYHANVWDHINNIVALDAMMRVDKRTVVITAELDHEIVPEEMSEIIGKNTTISYEREDCRVVGRFGGTGVMSNPNQVHISPSAGEDLADQYQKHLLHQIFQLLAVIPPPTLLAGAHDEYSSFKQRVAFPVYDMITQDFRIPLQDDLKRPHASHTTMTKPNQGDNTYLSEQRKTNRGLYYRTNDEECWYKALCQHANSPKSTLRFFQNTFVDEEGIEKLFPIGTVPKDMECWRQLTNRIAANIDIELRAMSHLMRGKDLIADQALYGGTHNRLQQALPEFGGGFKVQVDLQKPGRPVAPFVLQTPHYSLDWNGTLCDLDRIINSYGDSPIKTVSFQRLLRQQSDGVSEVITFTSGPIDSPPEIQVLARSYLNISKEDQDTYEPNVLCQFQALRVAIDEMYFIADGFCMAAHARNESDKFINNTTDHDIKDIASMPRQLTGYNGPIDPTKVEDYHPCNLPIFLKLHQKTEHTVEKSKPHGANTETRLAGCLSTTFHNNTHPPRRQTPHTHKSRTVPNSCCTIC